MLMLMDIRRTILVALGLAAACESKNRIVHGDGERLGRYLARGLDPGGRAQWRSCLPRSPGRATRVGVRNIRSFNERPKQKPAPKLQTELPLTAKKEKIEAGADGKLRPGRWALELRSAGLAVPDN